MLNSNQRQANMAGAGMGGQGFGGGVGGGKMDKEQVKAALQGHMQQKVLVIDDMDR